ncbi:MAG: nuclear transport factor 2 family protein, partial [Verrucomicrobiota bacterium]
WLKGFEQIKQMYHQDMTACQFYDSKAEEMTHRLLGDVAVVSFIHKFKYLIHDTQARYRIHIRTTATLRKDGDRWKIVSEHSSPIKGIERSKRIFKKSPHSSVPSDIPTG